MGDCQDRRSFSRKIIESSYSVILMSLFPVIFFEPIPAMQNVVDACFSTQQQQCLKLSDCLRTQESFCSKAVTASQLCCSVPYGT